MECDSTKRTLTKWLPRNCKWKWEAWILKSDLNWRHWFPRRKCTRQRRLQLEGQPSPSQLHRPENCQPHRWVLSPGARSMGSPVTRFCFARGISIIPWRLKWWPGVSTAQKGSTIRLCGHAKETGSGHLGNKSRSTWGVWFWVHVEKILLLYSSSGNWPVPSPGPPTWELWSNTRDTHLLLAQHPHSLHWVLRACGVVMWHRAANQHWGELAEASPPRSWLSTETLLPPPGRCFLH